MKTFGHCILVMGFLSAPLCAQETELLAAWAKKLQVANDPLREVQKDSFLSVMEARIESKNRKSLTRYLLTERTAADGDRLVYSTSVSDLQPVSAVANYTPMAVGQNPSYWFALGRNKRNDHWLLREIAGRDETPDSTFRQEIDSLKHLTQPPFVESSKIPLEPGFVGIDELSSLNQFELVAARETEGGRQLELRFKHTFPENPRSPKRFGHCLIWISSERQSRSIAGTFFPAMTGLAKSERRRGSSERMSSSRT